ncbi:hypothetical protein ANCCAN_17616, partial [Ancylostoma caninum]
MKGDPAFTFGTPEEQVIIVNRILRAASVAKEKIVKLASSYLLTNKCDCDNKYEQHHGGQEERSDYERGTEECQVSPNHEQVYDDYYHDAAHYDHESQRKNTEEPMFDPDYFEQMIDEVKTYSEDESMDGDHDLVLENISSDEGDARDNNEDINDETWRRRRLREDLLQVEHVLRNFPFRKIGESSRGVESSVECAFCRRVGQHYSDSCPEVTNGDERYNIVRHGGLCKHCLDHCPPDKCKFKPRGCWYCERNQSTIVGDLMPDDGGQHRALCNVPNARNTLRRRIEDIRRQLNGMKIY